jgi:pSer/pThr/pTyr-binding forkhead associated (FHA) protein
MSHFERGSERHQIPPGESALAIQAGDASVVPGPGGPGRRAILRAAPEGEVVIVKVQDADLTINGVRLGSEPTPLLHGDKVGAEDVELTFVDERRSGSTVFMAALQAPAAEGGAAAGPAAASATGGRLVCLTDGREYAVTASSLVFGREAGCDVVVPGKDVSRRHAEILPTGKGYLLIDHSTNGTFVNDDRIAGQRLLARGDLVRVGTDEFRFHAEHEALRESEPRHAALQATLHEFSVADVVTASAAPEAASEAPPAPTPPPASPAPERSDVGHAPAGDQPQRPLASFLLRGGARKGTRLPVRGLVANVGRAEYNDVVLEDESVSAQHAKLQRREGIWVLVDLESTNGTFVDGERVDTEIALAPGSIVRFGDVKSIFEPMDDALGMGTGAPKTSLLGKGDIAALEERVRQSAVAFGEEPSSPVEPDRPVPPEAAPAPIGAAPTPSVPPPPVAPAVEATPATLPPAAETPSAAPVAERAEPVVREERPARPAAARGRPSPQPRPPAPRRDEGARGSWLGVLIVVAAAVAALIWFLT